MKSKPLPLMLEVDQLHDLLPAANLLPVAVCQASVFAAQHITGSALVQPAELVSGIRPAVGKLPTVAQLSALFSRIGLTPETHVIAYDDEGGGWAGRLIWTLDVIGHKRYSYLNGGLIAWFAAGYPMQSGSDPVPPTQYTATIDQSQLVSLAQVEQQLSNPDAIVWDARGSDEFAGTKLTAIRNGHIPNAVNLDWLELMDRHNDLRLLPLPVIAARLDALGITAGKQIITHCHTHHRSGLTYLVGKALGMDIKAYDGSWAEWGNHPDTPVVTASASSAGT